MSCCSGRWFSITARAHIVLLEYGTVIHPTSNVGRSDVRLPNIISNYMGGSGVGHWPARLGGHGTMLGQKFNRTTIRSPELTRSSCLCKHRSSSDQYRPCESQTSMPAKQASLTISTSRPNSIRPPCLYLQEIGTIRSVLARLKLSRMLFHAASSLRLLMIELSSPLNPGYLNRFFLGYALDTKAPY